MTNEMPDNILVTLGAKKCPYMPVYCLRTNCRGCVVAVKFKLGGGVDATLQSVLQGKKPTATRSPKV